MAVKPVPEGLHTVTPYLRVEGAAKLIEFLKQTFGAGEEYRAYRPDGGIMHAQVRIGNSSVMLADATSESPPQQVTLYVFLEDTDATYRRALDAGGVSLREPADQFYGDRNAGVRDPWGNEWWIATHIEDVSPGELERRVGKPAPPAS
jgi:PhnB protein